MPQDLRTPVTTPSINRLALEITPGRGTQGVCASTTTQLWFTALCAFAEPSIGAVQFGFGNCFAED